MLSIGMERKSGAKSEYKVECEQLYAEAETRASLVSWRTRSVLWFP